LIDAGPDCRAQLLAAGVGEVDAVIFTHAHADHVMGIDDLRQINRNTGRALPAYGFPETLDELAARFSYAFNPATSGFYRPALARINVLDGEELMIGSMSLKILEQDHRVTRTIGIRAGGFAYSTDVVRMPATTMAALVDLEAWVVGCFRPEPHPMHAGLDDIRRWTAELKPGRTILTHMSSSMDWASLKASLPAGVEAGYDQLRLEGSAAE
jgi:phosphoribosyl 1,2-cyclic phosphate phosphodiesterase